MEANSSEMRTLLEANRSLEKELDEMRVKADAAIAAAAEVSQASTASAASLSAVVVATAGKDKL